MSRSRTSVLLLSFLALLAGPNAAVLGEEEDPAEKWVGAYGWLRTGERLAEVDLWPLALGSYIEAHRQVEKLGKEHPAFEPEMITYRLEWLEEEIGAVRERLDPGEHEIMRKYVDFIDSFEQGMKLRFEDRYAEALDTLDIAKVLLDEIIFENPDDFQEAVDTQYQLMQESIVWLDSQINFRQRSRPVAIVGNGVEWGTTEFIEQQDLPAEKGNLVEASLFPGAPVRSSTEESAVAGSSAAVGEAGEVASTGPMEVRDSAEEPMDPLAGFRMSSKQSRVPSLPEELAPGEDSAGPVADPDGGSEPGP